jgi:hypothetical protein
MLESQLQYFEIWTNECRYERDRQLSSESEEWGQLALAREYQGLENGAMSCYQTRRARKNSYSHTMGTPVTEAHCKEKCQENYHQSESWGELRDYRDIQ